MPRKLIFIYSFPFSQSTENQVCLKRKRFFKNVQSSVHIIYTICQARFPCQNMLIYHFCVATVSEWSVLLVASITDGTIRQKFYYHRQFLLTKIYSLNTQYHYKHCKYVLRLLLLSKLHPMWERDLNALCTCIGILHIRFSIHTYNGRKEQVGTKVYLKLCSS